MSWEKKVNERIASLAREAWVRNRKKPGYILPLEADLLVKALGNNDEECAKAILMYGVPALADTAEVTVVARP